jgi:hypothetical protein
MKTLILSLILLGAASAAQAVLTSGERAYAQTLDPAARPKYIAMREYVYKADLIVNQGADPTSLGLKPPVNLFDANYYKGNEAKMVAQARDLSNIALMNGVKIGK